MKLLKRERVGSVTLMWGFVEAGLGYGRCSGRYVALWWLDCEA